MIRQPKVPLMNEGQSIPSYLHDLILFLKDFCLEIWKAVTDLQNGSGGIQSVSVLPSAGSGNHLSMMAVSTGGTEQVYINILVDGTYTWKKLGSVDGGGSSSSTARLGTAALGTMILGKE